MKTIILIFLMLRCVAVGADHYYIVVDPATTNEIRSYKAQSAENPVTASGMARMEVTKAEYDVDAVAKPEDRLKGIDPAKIAAALQAVVDAKGDVDSWDDAKMKAVVKALVKVVNIRLPAGQKITAAELKAAIKEEL